jgi:flagellar biosynthetic protein FliS
MKCDDTGINSETTGLMEIMKKPEVKVRKELKEDPMVKPSLPPKVSPLQQIVSSPAPVITQTITSVVPNTNTSTSQYLENEVMTASPEKLTLMLYDGAIRFMNQAVIHIIGNNIASSNNASLRAQDIFAELMCTLDMAYPISKDLYNLYDFIKNSLIQANIKKDSSLIREMIAMTRDLRNTWAQAMQITKKAK